MRKSGDVKGTVGCYMEVLDLLNAELEENGGEVDGQDNDGKNEDDLQDGRENTLLQIYEYCSEISAPVMSDTYIPRRTSPQDLHLIQGLCSSVFRTRTTLHGKQHPDTLASMYLLIWLSYATGHWSRAIRLARDFIQPNDGTLGLSKERIDIKRVLALMLRELDTPEKQQAQTLLEEVHQFHSQLLGASHEKTIQSMVELILLMHSMDQVEEAMALLNPFTRLVSNNLSGTNPNTLLCLSLLALLQAKAGREDDAMEIVRKLAKEFEGANGAPRRALVVAMANRARVLVELEAEDAEVVFEDLIDLQASSLPEDHPDVLVNREDYALLLQSLGEVQRALAVRESIVERRKRSVGIKHPYTLRAMFEQASCMGACSRFTEAKAILEEVVEGYGETLGRKNGRYIESVQALGLMLVQLGELFRARTLHEQVLQLLSTKYGQNDEKTIAAMISLAGVIWSSGMETDGLAMEVKAMDLQRSVLGAKHPSTLQTMHNHAVTLQSIGRYSTSLTLLKEVHASRKDVLGEAHPHTVASFYSLAVSLEGLGENEEAMSIVESVVALAETSHQEGEMGQEEVDEYKDALTEMRKEVALFQKKFGGLTGA